MDKALRAKVSLFNPIHFLALGFGSGLAPKAPGTFGSLAAIPLLLLIAQTQTWWFVALAIFVCVMGIWICDKTAYDMGVHDHGSIVWDEIAGMFCAFIFVPLSWDTLLLGFLLFRWLDIQKPWLIGRLDKAMKGGLGIMADDILAGVITALLLHLYLVLKLFYPS